MWKGVCLTNWARTQAGSLFHEAVEIRHLLVQHTEGRGRILTLSSFSSECLVIFWVFAEVIDTELCNLSRSVSFE